MEAIYTCQSNLMFYLLAQSKVQYLLVKLRGKFICELFSMLRGPFEHCVAHDHAFCHLITFSEGHQLVC